ncbi:helix-turn-helix domain-containing protein [Rhizobium laguerreae]|uniref:helix-turn-helix domain-containing protein n=1 Tax=Rhizobium laguerreae TaxID=1076926 RepID=UPI001C90C40B|nr:helix-turn-helix domain-containing protein [Rhizobium laguerreae]
MITLFKLPAEGTTKLHVRFKGGKIQPLTTMNPKSSAQQIKTKPSIVELVDKLLDDYIYPEIAEILNEQGHRPGGTARRGCHDARFTPLKIAYLIHEYKLQSRYDRLRQRGMLTRQEAAAHLKISEQTVARWAKYGLIARHAYNGHYSLYEMPEGDLPRNQYSRWNQLEDRAAARRQTKTEPKTSTGEERGVV